MGKFQSWTLGLPHSTAPCPILIMLNTRLGVDKYKFVSRCFDSTWFEPTKLRCHDLPKFETDAHLIQPSRLALKMLKLLVVIRMS